MKKNFSDFNMAEAINTVDFLQEWVAEMKNEGGDRILVEQLMIAVAAVKEKNNPPPLTLDELTAMTGDSVWIEAGNHRFWGVCRLGSVKTGVNWANCQYQLSHGVKFYRNKPKVCSLNANGVCKAITCPCQYETSGQTLLCLNTADKEDLIGLDTLSALIKN